MAFISYHCQDDYFKKFGCWKGHNPDFKCMKRLWDKIHPKLFFFREKHERSSIAHRKLQGCNYTEKSNESIALVLSQFKIIDM